MTQRTWINWIVSGVVCTCVAGAFGQDKPAEKKPEPAKPAAPAKQDAKPADKPADKPAGAPSAEEKAMMDAWAAMSAPNENHKLLAKSVGEWTYVNKYWMDPKAEPSVSTGTATFKSLFDGRYVQGEHVGKMQMPGPDGKMTDVTFMGSGINGYDNMTKKFFGTWIDNMGTGIIMLEGSYDAASKTFTYTGSMPDMMAPGKTVKIREVFKVVDDNKHLFEWYETRDGAPEVKSMEITYTRKK
jgi:Protein of unknown function (DUF1579)